MDRTPFYSSGSACSDKGSVLLPDGSAADRAEVLVHVKDRYLCLKDGLFVNSHQLGDTYATADDFGNFELPEKEETRALFATHPKGFGNVTIEEFRKTGTIQLHPWGTLNGRVTQSGMPVAGERILFFRKSDPNSAIRFDATYFQTVSDSSGSFRMTYVPPGTGEIIYIDRNKNTLDSKLAKPIIVNPGKETSVELEIPGTILNRTTPKLPREKIATVFGKVKK